MFAKEITIGLGGGEYVIWAATIINLSIIRPANVRVGSLGMALDVNSTILVQATNTQIPQCYKANTPASAKLNSSGKIKAVF